VPLSDYFLRVPQNHAAAKYAARAAGELQSATRGDVALDARLAYYDWVRAVYQVRVAEQSLAQAKKHADTAHHQAEVGTATRADVLRVDAQVADAQLGLERARTNETVTREEMRALLHDGDDVSYRIGESVAATPALPQSFAELWAQARKQRPELRAGQAQAQALDKQAQAQRAAWLPRLDLVGGVDYANPNQRSFPMEDEWSKSWDVTVQLSWTPTDLMGGRAGQRAAEARTQAARAELRQSEDAVRVEVLNAYEAYQGARVSVDAATTSLTAAEEAYRVRKELFDNGRATSLELTDAELTLTQAQLDAVNARVDLRVALAMVAHAVGGETH
jgi:outer membrane protein TolC